MAITINGNGTIGGVSVGGLPDGAVTPSDLSTGHPNWDSSGNVGIGTSSPSSYNSAMNNLVAYGSGDSGITIASGTASEGSLAFADGTTGNEAYRGWINYNHGSDFMRMFTAGAERMRIDSSGKVSLGNTSSDGWLQIKNNNQSDVLITTNDTSGLGGAAMRFKVNNTTVGSISNNTTTTFYNTSSDYRLKENVVEVTDGIDRVKLLKPSRFNFIVDPDKTVDGFLAHEVADVVPEAITGTKDAMRTEDVYDEDGNVTGTQEVPDYQGIDQSKLVPLLTAALQEAITKIETLEARVATLESA